VRETPGVGHVVVRMSAGDVQTTSVDDGRTASRTNRLPAKCNRLAAYMIEVKRNNIQNICTSRTCHMRRRAEGTGL
jgi:hypothetical protein